MNPMNTCKTLTFLAGMMLATLPVTAQTSRPIGADTPPSPERRWGGMGGGGRFDGAAGGPNMGGGDMSERPYRRGQGRNVTDEQWDEILKFMREVSPRRTAAYDEMSSPDNKFLLKRLITARYDALMNTKREDPTLYDVQVDKLKAEDTIFGMLQDSKTSGMNDETKKALREHVTKLVESNFKEREMRIEKAKKSLADAVARLEEDRKSKDTMIEDRLNQYLRDGARPLKMERQDRPERDNGARIEAKRDPQAAAD